MVAGAGMLAYDAAKDWDWSGYWKQSKDAATDSWRNATGQNDYSSLPNAPYGDAVPNVAPGSIIPIERGPKPQPLNQWNYPRLPYTGPLTTNDEAAAANPDVVMIRDQRERAARPAPVPRVDVQNHLDVNMTLDGHALDHKIDSVVQRRENQTSDDIQSSVDR
jgi:hypothetical protein